MALEEVKALIADAWTRVRTVEMETYTVRAGE